MYAIVDIETTGGHASANSITEIAVYIHDGNRVVKKFETLINPQKKIPYHITALTGIDNATVANAPLFEDIAETLFELLQDKIFVAHSVNFDYSFIKHQLKFYGYNLSVKKLCTVRLGRKVFPNLPSYSLGNICRELKIPIDNRHRAGGDAKATVLLFEKYLQNDGLAHITAMLKKQSSEQWLPLHLNKEDVQNLPNKPGVYYFHDAKQKVVYVGKAVNIKKRVSSHFTHNAPDRKRQDFLRTIHTITHKECATELEALVLESTEIKRLWPKYNASQKQPQQRFGLYSFEDGKGYIRLAIDKKKKHLPALYTFNLLNEGMVLLKKMIEQFELNDKLCFVNKQALTQEENNALETPKNYNKKIATALQELNKQLPTFAVIDDGKIATEKLCLLIEKGNFWGMGYLSNYKVTPKLAELKEILTPYTDNDYIRNSIYSFVENNPHKKIELY
jgi:DNA polymerase III subunit epsilon